MEVPKKILEYIKDMDLVEAFESLTDIMGYSEKESAEILNVSVFRDLKFKPHRVVPNGKQAYMEFGDKWISVVGGGSGLYGDGETTFEVFTSEIPDPLPYLSPKEVNKVLLELQ